MTDKKSLPEIIAEIDRLAEKATQGEWERDFDTRYDRHNREHHKEHFITTAMKRCVVVALNQDAETLTQDDECRLEDLQARADLDLVCALKNNWERVTAELKRMMGEKDAAP